jgi:hypothetical protein
VVTSIPDFKINFNGLAPMEDCLRTVSSFLLVDSECTVRTCLLYVPNNFCYFCLNFQKFILMRESYIAICVSVECAHEDFGGPLWCSYFSIRHTIYLIDEICKKFIYLTVIKVYISLICDKSVTTQNL